MKSNLMRRSRSFERIVPHEVDYEVELERTNSADLGFHITGGCDYSEDGDEGIYISHIVPGGVAELSGLRFGDKILAINNISCAHIKHNKAVRLLRQPNRFTLVQIRRNISQRRRSSAISLADFTPLSQYPNNQWHPPVQPPTSGLPAPSIQWFPVAIQSDSTAHYDLPYRAPHQAPISRASSYHSLHPMTYGVPVFHPPTYLRQSGSMELRRSRLGSMDSSGASKRLPPERFLVRVQRDRQGLGFVISSKETSLEEPIGFFISGIMEGSAAKRNGLLCVGDRIISIDGYNLDHMPHEEVVSLLTGPTAEVSLLLERQHRNQDYDSDYQMIDDEKVSLNHRRSSSDGSYRSRPSSRSSRRHQSAAQRGDSDESNRSKPSSRGHSPRRRSAERDGSDESYRSGPSSRSSRHRSAQRRGSDESSRSKASSRGHSPLRRSAKRDGNDSQSPAGGMGTNHRPSIETGRRNSGGSSRSRRHSDQHSSQIGHSFESHPPSIELSTNGRSSVQTDCSDSGDLEIVHSDEMEDTLPFPPPPIEMGTTSSSIIKQRIYEKPHETQMVNYPLNDPGHFPLITEDILVRKYKGRLGLRIVGGIDSPCTPFGTDPYGIYIAKVLVNEPAAKSKRLRMGDCIVKINGVDITRVTHQQAVAALSDADSQLILTVRHDPPPPGLAELVVRRNPYERFGMRIRGGIYPHGYLAVHPQNQPKCGIFISRIEHDGAVHRDGRLKVGMRILEANKVTLVGATCKKALDALMKSSDMLHIIVCDSDINSAQSTLVGNQQEFNNSQQSDLTHRRPNHTFTNTVFMSQKSVKKKAHSSDET